MHRRLPPSIIPTTIRGGICWGEDANAVFSASGGGSVASVFLEKKGNEIWEEDDGRGVVPFFASFLAIFRGESCMGAEK